MRNKLFAAVAVALLAVAAFVMASPSKNVTTCPDRPGCICSHK